MQFMDSAFKYRDFSEVEMTNVGLLTEIASYGHLSLAACRSMSLYKHRESLHRESPFDKLRVTVSAMSC